MDDETSALFQELVNMLVDTRDEVAALRQVLVDKKLTTDTELAYRIEDVKRTEGINLKVESLRRSWEKALQDRPKQ